MSFARHRFFLLALVLLVSVPSVTLASTKPRRSDFIVRGDASTLDPILAANGLEKLQIVADASDGGLEVALVRAPKAMPSEEVLERLSTEPGIAGVEKVEIARLPETYSNVVLDQSTLALLDAIDRTALSPLGALSVWRGFVNQPAAKTVRASQARDLFPGEDTVVAVIDTGIDPFHPLLAPHLVPGYDFLRDRPGYANDRGVLDQSTMALLDQSTLALLDQSTLALLDQSTIALLDESVADALAEADATFPPSFGHGTMVAGIIHLVAPEAKLMPLRVFNRAGRANTYNIIKAIYWAVNQGATVINMSFSMRGQPEELHKAIAWATAQDVVCVASAGNHGRRTRVYPAAFDETIGVAATDPEDFLTSFSNYGRDLVTVAAPGHTIITTFPGGGWAAGSGTSYATPWIAGGVALFADKLDDAAGGGGEKGGSPADGGGLRPSSRASLKSAHGGLKYSTEIQGDQRNEVGYGRANLLKALRNVQ